MERHSTNQFLAVLRNAANDGSLWHVPTPTYRGTSLLVLATRYLVTKSPTARLWKRRRDACEETERKKKKNKA